MPLHMSVSAVMHAGHAVQCNLCIGWCIPLHMSVSAVVHAGHTVWLCNLCMIWCMAMGMVSLWGVAFVAVVPTTLLCMAVIMGGV